MNPELELLRFLTDRGFEHIAPLEGYITSRGSRSRRRSRSCSDSSARAATAGRSRSTRSPRIRAGCRRTARRLGEVTAGLHNALASDPADPSFAPEEPSTESLALLSASIDEEIEQVFLALPDIAGARADRAAAARRCATGSALLSHIGPRRPGDPPPRRLPPRPGALERGRGLARSSTSRASRRDRCPSGGASARRCGTSPGCSARSPTPPRRR